MSNVWELCEKLVSTVARAFYTDQYVVVLDALVREKFIMEEEIGPRLKLSSKDVRKITTQLESEMLIKFENVYADDNRSFMKCYYIDYKVFFHSVLYRVHLMQKSLRSEEKSELSEVFYQCPTCKTKSSSLVAMRVMNNQGKFLCSSCCPTNNFQTSYESWYILEEIDNRGKLSAVQALEKKLKEQLSPRVHDKEVLHEGIFFLLFQLKQRTNIPTNKPSENMKVGVRSSTVMDEDVQEGIKLNLQFATGQFGASLIRKPTAKSEASSNNQKNNRDMFRTEFDINIIETDESSSSLNNSKNRVPLPGNGMAAAREASLPEFLRDSRVIGAAGVVKAAEAMQEERGVKRAKGEDGSEVVTKLDSVDNKEQDADKNHEGDGAADEADNDDDDDDDVVWED